MYPAGSAGGLVPRGEALLVLQQDLAGFTLSVGSGASPGPALQSSPAMTPIFHARVPEAPRPTPNDAYVTSYQAAHCSSRTCPPTYRTEFPPQRDTPNYRQGHFDLGYDACDILPTKLKSTQCQPRVPTRLDGGTCTHEDYFMSSLRSYRSPSPEVPRSHELLQRLLAYQRAENFNKSSCHMKTPEKPKPENLTPAETARKTRTPRCTKTKGTRPRKPPKPCRAEEQLLVMYDYLNAANKAKTGWGKMRDMDVRYLTDLTTCIRASLGLLDDDDDDDDSHVCQNMRQRYADHMKHQHRKHNPSRSNTKLPRKSSSKCCCSSHQKLSCQCREDDREIDDKVDEWVHEIPVFPDETIEDKNLRCGLINRLKENLKKIPKGSGFLEKAKYETTRTVEIIPMWLPESESQKDITKRIMIDNLLSKLDEIKLDLKKIREEVSQLFHDLKYYDTCSSQCPNSDKESIIEGAVNNIKNLIVHRPLGDEEFKENSKSEVIDALEELPLQIESGNKTSYINKLADTMTDKILKIADRANLKPSDNKEQVIGKWLNGVPEFADINKSDLKKLVENLTKQIRSLKDADNLEEIQNYTNEFIEALSEKAGDINPIRQRELADELVNAIMSAPKTRNRWSESSGGPQLDETELREILQEDVQKVLDKSNIDRNTIDSVKYDIVDSLTDQIMRWDNSDHTGANISNLLQDVGNLSKSKADSISHELTDIAKNLTMSFNPIQKKKDTQDISDFLDGTVDENSPEGKWKKQAMAKELAQKVAEINNNPKLTAKEKAAMIQDEKGKLLRKHGIEITAESSRYDTSLPLGTSFGGISSIRGSIGPKQNNKDKAVSEIMDVLDNHMSDKSPEGKRKRQAVAQEMAKNIDEINNNPKLTPKQKATMIENEVSKLLRRHSIKTDIPVDQLTKEMTERVEAANAKSSDDTSFFSQKRSSGGLTTSTAGESVEDNKQAVMDLLNQYVSEKSPESQRKKQAMAKEMAQKIDEINNNPNLSSKQKEAMIEEKMTKLLQKHNIKPNIPIDQLAKQINSKVQAGAKPSTKQAVMDLLNQYVSDKSPEGQRKKQAMAKEMAQNFDEINNNPNLSSKQKEAMIEEKMTKLLQKHNIKPNIPIDQLAKQINSKVQAGAKPSTKQEVMDLLNQYVSDRSTEGQRKKKAIAQEVVKKTNEINTNPNLTPKQKTEMIQNEIAKLLRKHSIKTDIPVDRLAKEMTVHVQAANASISDDTSTGQSVEDNKKVVMDLLNQYVSDKSPEGQRKKQAMAKEMAQKIDEINNTLNLSPKQKEAMIEKEMTNLLQNHDIKPNIPIEQLAKQINAKVQAGAKLSTKEEKETEDIVIEWIHELPIDFGDQEEEAVESLIGEIKEWQKYLQINPSAKKSNMDESCLRYQVVRWLNKYSDQKNDLTLMKNVDDLLKRLKSRKRSADSSYPSVPNYSDLEQLIEDISFPSDVTPEEQERFKELKGTLFNKLITKLAAINADSDIIGDDHLYKTIAEDEIHKLLEALPQSSELDNMKPAIKEKLLKTILEGKDKARSAQEGHVYVKLVRDAIQKILPHGELCTAQDQGNFEVFRDNIADRIIELQDTQDIQEKPCRMIKLKEAVAEFFDGYYKKNTLTCPAVDPCATLNSIIKNVGKIERPNGDALKFLLEEIKIKNDLRDWVKTLPLRTYLSSQEELTKNKMIALPVKRLHEMEQQNEDENYQSNLEAEFVKWLKLLPLKSGADVDELAASLTNQFRDTKERRRVKKFPSRPKDPCPCSAQVTSPLLSLSPEDQAHLKRIRERASVGIQTPATSDACVCPRPIDTSSQTRFPRTRSSQVEISPNVLINEFPWESNTTDKSRQSQPCDSLARKSCCNQSTSPICLSPRPPRCTDVTRSPPCFRPPQPACQDSPPCQRTMPDRPRCSRNHRMESDDNSDDELSPQSRSSIEKCFDYEENLSVNERGCLRTDSCRRSKQKLHRQISSAPCPMLLDNARKCSKCCGSQCPYPSFLYFRR